MLKGTSSGRSDAQAASSCHINSQQPHGQSNVPRPPSLLARKEKAQQTQTVAFAENYTAHLATGGAMPSPIVLSKALTQHAVLLLDADRIHQASEWEAIQCALMGEGRTHPTAIAALRAVHIFSRAGKACTKDIEQGTLPITWESIVVLKR